MNQLRYVLMSLLVVLCILGCTTVTHAMPSFKLKGKWKLIQRKGTVRIYQMKIRGSRLIAMRGDVTFNAPIQKVIALMSAEKAKVKWVNRLKEVRILEQASPLDYVAYTRFKLPWPVYPRDFVTKIQVKVFPKEKKIIRYRYSIRHTKAPKRKGVVRAQMHYSRYIIQSVANGSKTYMRAEGYGDPKGSIPSFIVNMIQRGWPLKSIRGMQRQLRSGKIKLNPFYQQALAPKASNPKQVLSKHTPKPSNPPQKKK